MFVFTRSNNFNSNQVMSQYLSSSITNVVSLDLETSWAAKNLQEAIRQANFDARFQQKQMQEKEEKLLKLYENQQQRAIERVNRGSAGSNTSITSVTSVTTTQGGKVRQMFDERRQKAGIDRSYPLEPLKNTKTNGYTRGSSLDRLKNDKNSTSSKTVVKTTVKRSVTQVRNGKPLINKRQVVESVYNNNDGDESYEQHVYEDDNANPPLLNRTYRQRDLEMMMNDHHIYDNIDDEEFPNLDIDEFDEPAVKPKLVNVGGRLPSQNGTAVKKNLEQKVFMKNGTSATEKSAAPKIETKNQTKKVVTKTVSSPQASSISPKRSKGVSSVSSSASPSRSKASSVTMPAPTSSNSQNRKSSNDYQRVPSSQRPSSKQSGRGPSSVNRDDLEACKYCSRRFASDRLAVHEDICARTAKKKRKTYDATKHRVQGTELEPYTKKPNRTASVKPANHPDAGYPVPKQQIYTNKQSKQQAPSKKTDWRRKHEEFISAIRAAKVAQAHIAKGGKISDLPPPPPSSNPDYVQCPHCGRRFNETAAERHIPKCANYEFNKPKQAPRPGGGRNSSSRTTPSYR